MSHQILQILQFQTNSQLDYSVLFTEYLLNKLTWKPPKFTVYFNFNIIYVTHIPPNIRRCISCRRIMLVDEQKTKKKTWLSHLYRGRTSQLVSSSKLILQTVLPIGLSVVVDQYPSISFNDSGLHQVVSVAFQNMNTSCSPDTMWTSLLIRMLQEIWFENECQQSQFNYKYEWMLNK